MSWLATGAFYRIDGYLLDAPDDAAYDLVISVATGDFEVPKMAKVLVGWVSTRG
ncbi:MAG: hypothetical protein M3070_02510 [Actinomycetota bacterium]|nr:hypothetical protein [Actinomycetota bacterium]